MMKTAAIIQDQSRLLIFHLFADGFSLSAVNSLVKEIPYKVDVKNFESWTALHQCPAETFQRCDLLLCSEAALDNDPPRHLIALKKACPDVRVAVYAVSNETTAKQWLDLGIEGILSRHISPAALRNALAFILRGNRYLSPACINPVAVSDVSPVASVQSRADSSLLNTLPFGFAVIQRGKIAYANHALQNLLGLPERLILQRPYSDFIDEDHRGSLITEALAWEKSDQSHYQKTIPLIRNSRGETRVITCIGRWATYDGRRAVAITCLPVDHRTSQAASADSDSSVSWPVQRSDGAGDHAAPNIDGLTRRQREVLLLLSLGATNKNIAAELKISEATVKLHVHHILRTLKAKNRTEAALTARRADIKPPAG
jgi:DNA-binding NarL/FixJ family response regulator